LWTVNAVTLNYNLAYFGQAVSRWANRYFMVAEERADGDHLPTLALSPH
jgi:hypothetical protein